MAHPDIEYSYVVGDNIHVNLINAICAVKLDEVQKWLDDGADPNHEEGTMSIDPPYRPRTAMNILVTTVISGTHSYNQVRIYKKMAKLLIKYGGDRKEAMLFAEERYGHYTDMKIDYTRQYLIYRVLEVIYNYGINIKKATS